MTYVATYVTNRSDPEMEDRVARHRKQRPAHWTTIENRFDLKVLFQEKRNSLILVDCLTLWLSNLMHAGRSLEREIADLKAAIVALDGPAILVSNEVGLGLAPMTPLGREFRDWQGRLNAEIAEVADVVVAMTAGLPGVVKPAPRLGLVFG